jgi:hypothetical protein
MMVEQPLVRQADAIKEECEQLRKKVAQQEQNAPQQTELAALKQELILKVFQCICFLTFFFFFYELNSVQNNHIDNLEQEKEVLVRQVKEVRSRLSKAEEEVKKAQAKAKEKPPASPTSDPPPSPGPIPSTVSSLGSEEQFDSCAYAASTEDLVLTRIRAALLDRSREFALSQQLAPYRRPLDALLFAHVPLGLLVFHTHIGPHPLLEGYLRVPTHSPFARELIVDLQTITCGSTRKSRSRPSPAFLHQKSSARRTSARTAPFSYLHAHSVFDIAIHIFSFISLSLSLS